MRYLTRLPYEAEEALNRLRINVSLCGNRFKKIILTSSTPNEGKSFLATHLWRLMAKSQKKVVLVDADIRKSVLRSRYQISGGEKDFLGLSHYLAGSAELEDIVYSTNIEGGFLVPTSRTVSAPSLLLQNGRLEQALDALAQWADYVLVDTPPLANVADGDLIASHCDGAILVVRSGVTPKGLVADSLKQLERAGCELMGVVLNRVEEKGNPYYAQYKKYGNYAGYEAKSRVKKR